MQDTSTIYMNEIDSLSEGIKKEFDAALKMFDDTEKMTDYNTAFVKDVFNRRMTELLTLYKNNSSEKLKDEKYEYTCLVAHCHLASLGSNNVDESIDHEMYSVMYSHIVKIIDEFMADISNRF